MKKVLIVFAQTGEAKATIEMTNAKPVLAEKTLVWSEGVVPARYIFSQGCIAICGVGIHPAQMCVAKFASLYDEVWNLGFAGALKKEAAIGELASIASNDKLLPISKHLDTRSQECANFAIPSLNISDSGQKLITSDFPIHDNELRESLKQQWDLVDMEGYGVAYAAHSLGKKCRMWKIVSDFASPGGREVIRKHRHELSQKIAEPIMENLFAQPNESRFDTQF